MVDRRYTASKSRTQGRQAWSVSFRHPLRTDSKGKPGLKVRKGLGTADETEADRLVAQLNELLGDERFLNASAKNEATARFATVVADAFYADIDSTPAEGADSRDAIIPLPGAAEGYAHVTYRLEVRPPPEGPRLWMMHVVPDADAVFGDGEVLE